jgi:hypothetical protein
MGGTRDDLEQLGARRRVHGERDEPTRPKVSAGKSGFTRSNYDEPRSNLRLRIRYRVLLLQLYAT